MPKDYLNDSEIVEATLVDPADMPHTPVVHNPIVSVQPSKPMTALESEICELHSLGKSTKYISDTLGINTSTVRSTLAKPHIRDFVYELVNAQYTSRLEGRLRLINAVIDAKLEKIEADHDGDLSKSTSKDIVDLMVISDNMQKEKTKKELGTDSNVYLQIINQVTGS